MQEKLQNISPIKQRILYFIDYLNISKRKFYEKTGISRGTIESNTGITEEILAKFIATFDQVNIFWLIKGEGEMLNSNAINNTEPMNCNDCPYKNLINRLEEDITRYRDEISYLNKQLNDLRNPGTPESKLKSAS